MAPPVQPTGPPPSEPLGRLLLDMTGERTIDGLLQLMVARMRERPHVALARVWLLGVGDLCGDCVWENECPDGAHCLHLAASAGNPRSDAVAVGAPATGRSRRVPIGSGFVGRIIETGEGLVLSGVEEDDPGGLDSEWLRRDGIEAIAGHPLVFGEEVIGVLVVFLRRHPSAVGIPWLRTIADHAAAAVVNARTFEELVRLKGRLELENAYLREEVSEASPFGKIVGQSAPLRRLLRQVELVAPTDASVLILGESGTGKELIAHELHERSERRAHALVRVNCASIPRELYESEFFGHRKGAFTGAIADRAGRFELADGGTLFLDEVGEIPLALQSKLLRVLQEGTYERVGEEETRDADVRIIAATNRDLKREVEEGRFRQDLFYRLNVFPMEITPLRERREDIAPLAHHFLDLSAKRMGCDDLRLTQEDTEALQRYPWPGNVRELENVIERAVITSSRGRLRIDLPDGEPADSRPAVEDAGEILTEDEMRALESENLRRALERTGWKIYGEDGAAALLGLRPTTLSSRIRKLGIRAS